MSDEKHTIKRARRFARQYDALHRADAMSDDNKLRWCSCKASARAGQHMAWCAADAAKRLTAEIQEMRMQAISDTGQAQAAYEAQLAAEATVERLREENRKLRAALGPTSIKKP